MPNSTKQSPLDNKQASPFPLGRYGKFVPSYVQRLNRMIIGLFFGAIMVGLTVAGIWPDRPLELYEFWPFAQIARIMGLRDAHEAYGMTAETFNGLLTSIILFCPITVIHIGRRVYLEFSQPETTRPAPLGYLALYLGLAVIALFSLLNLNWDPPYLYKGLNPTRGIIPNAVQLGATFWVLGFACGEMLCLAAAGSASSGENS